MSTGVAPHPVIGVIGGMGPEATVDFMRRVIAATPAGDDGDHIHMIIDNNPKVPSRIAALIDGTGIDPAPELVRMAQGLQAAGATVLAIPCNTARVYAAAIAASVSIPLLNMVDLTIARIARMVLPNRRIGMLASSAVKTLGLYDKALKPLGVSLVWPERQSDVMSVIKAVKRGDVSAANRQTLAAIASALMARQVDMLLLACTELSVLASSLDRSAAVLDALDVLSAEIAALGLAGRKAA